MQSLSAAKLRQWMVEERTFLLVDVREDFERETFHIGGTHLPMSEATADAWKLLRQDAPIVVYCAKGVRSAIAIQRLEGVEGMPPMYNLAGGLKSWVEETGSTMPAH